MFRFLNYFRDYRKASKSDVQNFDFEEGLTQFLHEEFRVDRFIATSVAASACARMKGLSYHTPAHILSIFDFAEEQGIQLLAWQKLAIWFHDVIYDPNAPPKRNEKSSAEFLRLMLGNYIQNHIIDEACEAIEITAEHMTDKPLPEDMALILDLDICSFAWDRDSHMHAASLVAEEYLTIYSLPDYVKGRLDFLRKMQKKGFFFRTPLMQKYESVAAENIEAQIKALSNSSVSK
jgi:predicted metal-dependent HD superfamily phosphohydrolase